MITSRRSLIFLLLLAEAGCTQHRNPAGSSDGGGGDGAAGQGGGVGGAPGTGGSTATGGAPGTGASSATGGATGTGGSTAPGGAPGTAGAGTGGSTGAAGGGGAAGAAGTSAAGGSGGLGCSMGELQCGPSGHRQRCGPTGAWSDEPFVCTVQVSGSTDYKTVCAVKADGTLSCWGVNDEYHQQQLALFTARAAKQVWDEVTVSDGEWGACALDSKGAVWCWDPMSGPSVGSAGTFSHYVTTIYGDCGIRALTGELACFDGTVLPATGYTGRFTQLSVSNLEVYAIDDQGGLHKPASVTFPEGKYLFVTANNGMSCAVRDDGRLFCRGGSADDTFAPPTETAFAQVAMAYSYNTACGLRRDGTLTCWPGRPRNAAPIPPTGQFTQLASFWTGYCAIRRDGTTACWGDTMVVPEGW